MNKELEQAKKYIEDNNLSKAYEFMAKDDNVRDELAKSIEEAPYAKLDRSMKHKEC